MLAAELADPSELGQRIDVQNRHAGTVGAQDHVDAAGLDVAGEDLQRGITVDHDAQPAGEEILKASDDEGDRRRSGHRGPSRTRSRSDPYRHTRRK